MRVTKGSATSACSTRSSWTRSRSKSAWFHCRRRCPRAFVGALAVGEQVERFVERRLHLAEGLLGSVEVTLGLGDLAREPALLPFEQVDGNGARVVGVQELLALGGELCQPAALARRLLLRLLSHPGERLVEFLAHEVSLLQREANVRVRALDRPLDELDRHVREWLEDESAKVPVKPRAERPVPREMSDATPAAIQRLLAAEFERHGWEYDLTVGREIVEEAERRGTVNGGDLAKGISADFLARTGASRDEIADAIDRAIGGRTRKREEQTKTTVVINDNRYQVNLGQGARIADSKLNMVLARRSTSISTRARTRSWQPWKSSSALVSREAGMRMLRATWRR